jgi:signal transduction histidine kinase
MSIGKLAETRNLGISAAQALSVVLIVGLPNAAVQYALREGQQSAQWVDHSFEVRSNALELVKALRDAESVAYAEALHLQLPDIEQRFAAARELYDRRFVELRLATADNPGQGARLNEIGTLAQKRLNLLTEGMIRARAGDQAGAVTTLSNSATQVRPVIAISEFLVEEERLLGERQARDAAARSTVGWVGIAAALLQLALLAGFLRARARSSAIAKAHVQDRIRADQRSGQMLRSLRDPVVLLDGQLGVLSFNPAFAQAYPLDAVAEQPLGSALAGGWTDPGILLRLREVAEHGRELWDFELEQADGAKSSRVVLINSQRLPDASAGQRMLMLSVNDITARRRDEQELRRLNQRMRLQIDEVLDANRELESFSYSVAHDLRPPLRHIAGYTERLGMHLPPGDERSTRFIGIISRAVGRMAEIIDALLAYSRLGRTAIRRVTVDMDAICREAQTTVIAADEHSRIEWKIDVLPVASGDDSLLRLVWQNLLANAVKFSAGREPPRIEIGVLAETNSPDTVYFVRDNGVGFDMAHGSKLFGLFQRLHSIDQYPGTGVGLANVRRIVERHGGRVWAESAPDQGATFYFTLGTESDAPATARAEPNGEVAIDPAGGRR